MIMYHLTLFRLAIIKKARNNKCLRGYEKREPSYAVCRNVNCFSDYRKIWSPQKIKTRSYDPANQLLSIYPKNMKTLIWKDTCTPMFTVALLTIATFWKWPNCPWRDECIKKNVVSIHIMDLEGIMLSEINDMNKDKYHMISFFHGI